MNVLLVNGSPHKNGGTARSLAIIEEELHKKEIDTTWFQLRFRHPENARKELR